MPISPEQFSERLDAIRARLVVQGQKVSDLVEQVFSTIYERDTERARLLMARDDEIDQAGHRDRTRGG